MLKRLRVAAADAGAARLLMDRLAEPDEHGSEALATSSFHDVGAGRWQVDAYYESELSPVAVLARIGELLGPGVVPAIEDVPDENWVAVSQAALPPVAAGRFLIHGSHDRARIGRRRFAIEVDAGEAFGTAHHATTQGCLEAIDRLARRRRVRSILDLGCGSGVLAIAAARVWPRARIRGSDIDPVSIDVARENAGRNGARGRVQFAVADGVARSAIAGGRFDLIIANILAGPLIRLAPDLARAVSPGGLVVLSGLLGEQVREVTGVYRIAGFHLVTQSLEHNWATLTLARHSGRRCGRTANGRHQGAGRFETRRSLPDWAYDQ